VRLLGILEYLHSFWVVGERVQGPVSQPDVAEKTTTRTWLSPKASGPTERLAYAAVGAILLLVALAGFALVLLSWSVGDLPFGLFGLVLGVLALVLDYRMLVAAAKGRRLYWWPGQREYDQGGTR
jgi:membrane protein required for beta-lactamase induction